MVALLRIVVAVTLTLVDYHLAEAKTCSDPDVLHWIDDTCLYVAVANLSAFRPAYFRIQGCEIMLESDDRVDAWKLPKLDSIAKQKALVEALHKAGHKEAIFWTGLERREPESLDEAEDLKKWSDPTKWAWRVPGKPESVLSEYFKTEKVPWGRNQPDNEFWSKGNDTKIVLSEQCVIAKTTPEYPWVEWFDVVCFFPFLSQVPEDWRQSFRLLCEREITKPTSAAPALAGPNNGPTTKPSKYSESELMWIALGSIFGLLLISAFAIFGACMYKRRMKRKRTDSPGSPHRRSGSSQSNSSSDTSPRRWHPNNWFKNSKPDRDERNGRTTKMPLLTKKGDDAKKTKAVKEQMS